MTQGQQNVLVLLGIAAAATLSLLLWRAAFASASAGDDDDEDTKDADTRSLESSKEETKATAEEVAAEIAAAAQRGDKDLGAKIEELDRKGKKLFADKQYLEAAQVFTFALDLVAEREKQGSLSLSRQYITLMNNRSAMYEKGGLPELALEDCNAILDRETEHDKARKRKLRTLEGLHRYREALVEVCAMQLLYMKANRANAIMGLPMPPPPVPQTKLEELMNHIVPSEVETYLQALKEQQKQTLPSKFTILQLLRTYSGYNEWMAKAAQDGPISMLSEQMPPANTDDVESTALRATLLMKRGRRYVYDKEYALASADFEEGYALIEANPEAQHAMEDDSYARLVEWTGMVRHWHYQLDSAIECYQKVADIEPTNPSLLVKQAGVHMDAGRHEESLQLFDMALGLDPEAVDALLHRSNLKMLKGQPDEAKIDLERCVALRPSFVMARLRLCSVLAALEDVDGAKKQLDLAEQDEPNSCEVMSYRGELAFTHSNLKEARTYFDKAIELEPNNPTPYVNAAMTILNSPPASGTMPDVTSAMTLLEKAIEVDPQFTAAYMQLGQLALGTATDLAGARQVIILYDRALENCRTPEEIKELCSMRILAVAQVDAATELKMETFAMQ